MNSPDALGELSSRLGIAIDIAHYRVLVARARQPVDQAVAVIGLVSRGKSTLVNALAGVDVVPVDARAETSAVISVRSGEPRARGVDTAQREVVLDPAPMQFRSRVARSASPQLVIADFASATRLPPGLVLVDTPGVDDAESLTGGRFAHLQSRWADSGAAAALVVLSVPPGLSSQDRALIRTAEAAYDGRMIVIVKAIDSTVPDEEVEDTSSYISELCGVNALALPQGKPDGEWGSGPLGELEQQLTKFLAGPAEQRTAAAALMEFLDPVVAVVNGTGDAHLPDLELALEMDSLPPVLSEAVQRRVEELRARSQRRAEAEDQRRTELIDNQAAAVARVLPSEPRQLDPRDHTETLAELCSLMVEGSATALERLKPWFRLPPEKRANTPLNLVLLVPKLSEPAALRLIEGAALSEAEIRMLIPLAATRPPFNEVVRPSFEKLCQESLWRARSTLHAKSHPEFERLVITAHWEQLVQTAHASVRATSLENWHTAHQMIQAIKQKLDAGDLKNPLSDEEVALLRPTLVEQERELQRRVVSALSSAERQIVTTKPVDMAKVDAVWARAADASRWAAASGDPRAAAHRDVIWSPYGKVRTWAWHAHLAQVAAAEREKERAQRKLTQYQLSWLAFILGILVMFSNGELGFLLIIGAFFMWITSRDDRIERPWLELVEWPPYPTEAGPSGEVRPGSRRGKSAA